MSTTNGASSSEEREFDHSQLMFHASTHDFSNGSFSFPSQDASNAYETASLSVQQDDQSSSPGNLSLSQIGKLNGSERHAHSVRSRSSGSDSHVIPGWNSSNPNGFINDTQSSDNSLGLLGDDFSQNTSAHSSPPSQSLLQQNNQSQQQSQHQSFHSGMPGHNATFAPIIDQNTYNRLQASALHRQQSLSSLSDASSSSIFNDGASLSDGSHFGVSSPHKDSFNPPLQSPLGMSSFAGLAIGTPQQHVMNPSALEEFTNAARHDFQHHEDLLSLSGTQPTPGSVNNAHIQLMAPPQASSRRRSTAVAHSLYTNQLRQLRQDMSGDQNDSTPIPPSQQTFSSRPASAVILGMAAGGVDNAFGGLAEMPTTPRSGRTSGGVPQHPATMPSNHHASNSTFYSTQAQIGPHHGTSPANSSVPSGSIAGSAFSAPRLLRMESYDSFTSNGSSPDGSNVQPVSGSGANAKSLEKVIAEHEAKLAAARSMAYADVGQRPHAMPPQTPDSATIGDRTLSPDSTNALSSSSMSRVSSAPPQSLSQHSRDGSLSATHAVSVGVPSTPVRSSLGLHHPAWTGTPPYPTTPITNLGPHGMSNMLGMPGFPPHTQPVSRDMFMHHHRIHELTMSAPQMAMSRSLNSLPLMSPTSSMDAHPLFSEASGHPFGPPLDTAASVGEDASHSALSGAVRNDTPRRGGRSAGPPPLIVSSADKLHACRCGKRFKRLEHLKRHYRVHTQERPHQCPEPGCNKWFGRTDNLTQHMRTHLKSQGGQKVLNMSHSVAAARAGGAENRLIMNGANSVALVGARAGMKYDDVGHSEARHDPHAAASAAAARAVSKNNMKRKIDNSGMEMLGQPITLSPAQPLHENQRNIPSLSPHLATMEA